MAISALDQAHAARMHREQEATKFAHHPVYPQMLRAFAAAARADVRHWLPLAASNDDARQALHVALKEAADYIVQAALIEAQASAAWMVAEVMQKVIPGNPAAGDR